MFLFQRKRVTLERWDLQFTVPMRLIALAVVVVTQVGCATILSGTRQTVTLESVPPGAPVVVVGGAAAQLAVKLQKATQVRDLALKILQPVVSPELAAIMQQASPDELVTQLVILTQRGEIPPEWIQKAGTAVAKIPQPVVEKIVEQLGIEGIGATPYQVELKKGRPWAVVSWQVGHRGKLMVIDTKFNWICLLNILTAGLGMIVDVATGAWLSLDPTQVAYTLEPLPQPVAKTE